MTLFKKDPIKHLFKLLSELKVSPKVWWHVQNRADLLRVRRQLDGLAELRGLSCEGLLSRPDLLQDPFFGSVARFLGALPGAVEKLRQAGSRVPVDEAAVQSVLMGLDEPLNEVLDGLSRRGPPPAPLAIVGEGELKLASEGTEMRFMMGPDLAVFESDPGIHHSDLAGKHFRGKMDVGGWINPRMSLIEIFHGDREPEEVMSLFRRLGASESSRPLHHFHVRQDGRYIGKFICGSAGLRQDGPP